GAARPRGSPCRRAEGRWPGAEMAALVASTTTAANSGVRRAPARRPPAPQAEDELSGPADPERRALLDRFAAAVENADIAALSELLRDDVTLEMPPVLNWFTGRQAAVRCAALYLLTEPGRLRLTALMADGQPAC